MAEILDTATLQEVATAHDITPEAMQSMCRFWDDIARLMAEAATPNYDRDIRPIVEAARTNEAEAVMAAFDGCHERMHSLTRVVSVINEAFYLMGSQFGGLMAVAQARMGADDPTTLGALEAVGELLSELTTITDETITNLLEDK